MNGVDNLETVSLWWT